MSRAPVTFEAESNCIVCGGRGFNAFPLGGPSLGLVLCACVDNTLPQRMCTHTKARALEEYGWWCGECGALLEKGSSMWAIPVWSRKL